VRRLINVQKTSSPHIFIDFLEEKLLATKQGRAIFAIPKNDVGTAHLEGMDR